MPALGFHKDWRSEAVGARTRDLRIKSHGQTPENIGKTAVPADAGADAGAVETKTTHFPPDLQALIDAWPALPDAIRAGIVALVNAARDASHCPVKADRA
jgi:hypothetical protein